MSDYFSSKKYKDSKERIRKAFNFELEDFSQVLVPHQLLESIVGWVSERCP